jgi:hypothetical protein
MSAPRNTNAVIGSLRMVMFFAGSGSWTDPHPSRFSMCCIAEADRDAQGACRASRQNGES